MDGGDRSLRGGYDDKMIMNQIMLRFRPIAPKPAGDGGSASGYSDPDKKKKDMVEKKRAKRKYVRVKKSCVRKDPDNHKAKEGADWIGETVVTLELLPEIGKRFEEGGISKDADYSGVQQVSSLLSLNMGGNNFHVSDLVVVESSVTVECVTDTWVDGKALGSTDEERVMNMEGDTCPGLVSDGFERVRWTNKAYREMVGDEGERMMVGLVMKELVLLPLMSEAFTCRVRVTCRKERGWSKTLPCDVWRMDGGGYAWRLDIKAALCLGR